MLNDARIWDPVIAALDGAAPNGPALSRVVDFGRETTLAGMAEAAWDAARPAPVEQPLVIAGFSMGGYVALEMMARPTRRVDGVALLATAARAETPEGEAARAQTIAAIEQDFDHFVQRVARYSTHRRWHDDLVAMAAVRRMLFDCGAEMAIRQTRAVRHRSDQRAGLAAWRVPTVVMAGSEDRVVAPDLSEELASLISGAHFERVSECGHLLPLEQPQRVATALRALLPSATMHAANARGASAADTATA
jgi:pimeloyl-ACP methyl ester carboxylesterase